MNKTNKKLVIALSVVGLLSMPINMRAHGFSALSSKFNSKLSSSTFFFIILGSYITYKLYKRYQTTQEQEIEEQEIQEQQELAVENE